MITLSDFLTFTPTIEIGDTQKGHLILSVPNPGLTNIKIGIVSPDSSTQS